MEDQITGTGKPDDYPGYDHASFEKRTSKQGYFYVESSENEDKEGFTDPDTQEEKNDNISTDNTNHTENNMETGNNTIAIFRSPEEWKKLNSGIDILLKNMFRNVSEDGMLILSKEETSAYSELMALKTRINEIL